MAYNYLKSAAADELVVDIDNNDIGSGSLVQMLIEKTEANQWWTTVPVQASLAGGDSYFWIASGVPGLVLGIGSDSALRVVNKSDDKTQFWKQDSVQLNGQSGYFRLVNAAQGLVMARDAGGVSGLHAVAATEDESQYWTWVEAPVAIGPSNLGGNGQYFFSSTLPIQDLVVEIAVTEPIVVSKTANVNPTSLAPLPIGFQINGIPPKYVTPAGGQAIAWMQYAVRMWPGANTLTSVAEYWPPGVDTAPLTTQNIFQLSWPSPHGQSADNVPVLLPDNLTIPAGWTIRVAFRYQGTTITGFDCTVSDGKIQIGPDMTINFLTGNQPTVNPKGFITIGDLAELLVFQVVLVGFWNGAQSVLRSGAGTITCTASSKTPLTAGRSLPPHLEGTSDGTLEDANSIYGVVPSGSSASISQYFRVKTVAAPSLTWTKIGNTQGAEGNPNFGNTAGDLTRIGDFTGSGRSEVLFYSPGEGNWWLGTYAGGALQWVLVGNTRGGSNNFGNTAGDPTWIGDFTGSGRSEVLFYSPGEGNWWLGTYEGGALVWALVGNTQGGSNNFGNTAGDPTWIGDFTGSGQSEVLFYSPGDGKWWLGRYANNALQWAPLGNSPGGTTRIGDFTGVGRSQALTYTNDGNWLLATREAGKFAWALLGNTQGGNGGHNFGNTAGDPTWISDFSGSKRSQVLFYSPGEGNWWLGSCST